MPFSNPKFAHFNDVLLQISRSPILDSGDLTKTIQFILESAARCLEVERQLAASGRQRSTAIGG